MRNLHVARAALLTTAAVALAILTAAGPASADPVSFDGCPDGAVCLYNGATTDSGVESNGVFWSYGAHDLSGQEGEHAVVNNQTNGAWLTFCGGYGGRDPGLGSEAPNTQWPPYTQDLSPVNSIILTSGYNATCG